MLKYFTHGKYYSKNTIHSSHLFGNLFQIGTANKTHSTFWFEFIMQEIFSFLNNHLDFNESFFHTIFNKTIAKSLNFYLSWNCQRSINIEQTKDVFSTFQFRHC